MEICAAGLEFGVDVQVKCRDQRAFALCPMATSPWPTTTTSGSLSLTPPANLSTKLAPGNCWVRNFNQTSKSWTIYSRMIFRSQGSCCGSFRTLSGCGQQGILRLCVPTKWKTFAQIRISWRRRRQIRRPALRRHQLARPHHHIRLP